MVNKNLGRIIRCTGLALLVLVALALLPENAEAGVCATPSLHGVTVEKSCTSPKNRCATDADCADLNFCNGTEQCATEGAPGSNVVDCTATITNPLTHCDSITIQQAADAIIGGLGIPSSSSDILVSGTTGTVSGPGCDAGSNLGTPPTEVCTLTTGASISFRANYYTVQAADPTPLPDQATLVVKDECDGGTTGCSTIPNDNSFGAATELVSGCSGGTPLNCDDGFFCTDDSCVDATGCAHVPHPCPSDGLFCNGTEFCDEAGDMCGHQNPPSCPSDSLACNGTEFCDEAADACGRQNAPPACPNPTCAPCTEPSGQCVPIDPPPAVCVVAEFCRTPGFWGTHADDDCVPLVEECKACSQNITQTVLDLAPGGFIPICGEDICNTLVDDASSAVEAICMRVQGQITRQLARQLTAARLNCIVSGETTGPCNGISINDLFDACNTACAAGDVEVMVGPDMVNCIDALDCFNNGGMFDNASGACTTGTCVVNGLGPNVNGPIPCGPELPCAEGECVPLPNNCHDAAFPDDFLPNDFLPDTDPCSEKQGPAGSSDECKAAHKTMCTVIQLNESLCDTEEVCD